MKSKMDEDKKLNIFIIAIVLIIVISICAIVYGVQKQKSTEEETEIQSTVTLSQNEKQAVSDKAENSGDDTSVSGSSVSTTESSAAASSAKASASAGVNIESENKRYKEECSRINKKYDDIIATNEATKRLLLQEYSEKNNEIQNKQTELDILIASGAAISSSDKRYQEIASLQAQADDLQKGIDDADNKISNAKANKANDLAVAEKQHKANLNK